MSNEFKEGQIPPIGEKCEVRFDNDDHPTWFPCVFKGGFDAKIWFGCIGNLQQVLTEKVVFSHLVTFRPIQTHEHKVIEQAVLTITGDENATIQGAGGAIGDVLKDLYDAGMLVMPDNKKETK